MATRKCSQHRRNRVFRHGREVAALLCLLLMLLAAVKVLRGPPAAGSPQPTARLPPPVNIQVVSNLLGAQGEVSPTAESEGEVPASSSVSGAIVFDILSGKPDTADTVPFRNGTAEESMQGARMLYDQFVKTGGVTFNTACPHAERDFYDQMREPTPPNLNRVKGYDHIQPALWRVIQVLAEGFQKQHTQKPYVEISCIESDHRLVARGGNSSQHPIGYAADLSVLGGVRVSASSQGWSDTVPKAIRMIWDAGIYPGQLISLHDLPEPAIYDNQICSRSRRGFCGSFALRDHDDHLHIGL